MPERLDLKIRVFRELDRLAKPTAILASNTSGFPIAALAAATERPERVIGWHWASPPPVMKLAEIVATEQTSQSTIETVVEVARACGKNPVVVKDTAMAWGFVANRVYFAMLREAQRVVDEGDRHARAGEPAHGRRLPLAGRAVRDGGAARRAAGSESPVIATRTLAGGSVRLVPERLEHAELLARWNADPEVRHWLHRSEDPPELLDARRRSSGKMRETLGRPEPRSAS